MKFRWTALAASGLLVAGIAAATFAPLGAKEPASGDPGLFVGEIVERNHTVVDPGDGTELVLTGLTLRGTALAEGTDHGPPPPEETLQIWFPGGVLSEERGSFVADAPARHETRVGRWAVVRHAPSTGIGVLDSGQLLSGQVLQGGRAGLFTAFVSRSGELIVQGRPGTLLPRNLALGEARARLR